MSWKAYTDLVLKGDGVQKAGLFGQEGAVWNDQGTGVKPEEVKALVLGIKDNKNFTTSGVMIGGVKFMFLRAPSDTEVIARKGPTTALMCLSKKALIVALTKDGSNPANITSHTFVRDDLVKKNF